MQAPRDDGANHETSLGIGKHSRRTTGKNSQNEGERRLGPGALRSGTEDCPEKWSGRGSNPQPPHCERGALPVELPPHSIGPLLKYRPDTLNARYDGQLLDRSVNHHAGTNRQNLDGNEPPMHHEGHDDESFAHHRLAACLGNARSVLTAMSAPAADPAWPFVAWKPIAG